MTVERLLLPKGSFFRSTDRRILCRAPQLANTNANCSKQAARATPEGSLLLLCAGDTENAKHPGFSDEPKGAFEGRDKSDLAKPLVLR